jgi:hypothetical protein
MLPIDFGPETFQLYMGESSRRVLVILDFWRIVQLQIQEDAPIPEASLVL